MVNFAPDFILCVPCGPGVPLYLLLRASQKDAASPPHAGPFTPDVNSHF